jgi:acetyl esterase
VARAFLLSLCCLLGATEVSVASAPTTWQRLRSAAGALLIKSLVRGASATVNRLPLADPARFGVRRTRGLAYLGDGHPQHRLDVYTPQTPSATPRPVVVYVHGGGFTSLSKDTHHTLALEFAKQGYVVFNVDYRLAPKDPFPAAHQDVFSAYEWIVRNAAAHGGDVRRMVLAGESAGGNLVTSIAVAATQEMDDPAARRIYALGVVPKVVLPACGQLQISNSVRVEKTGLPRLVKDRMQFVERAYLGESKTPQSERAVAEPLLQLEHLAASGGQPSRPLPRFFAFAGTKDPLVDDTTRLHTALDRLGVDNRIEIYEGEGHAFHAMRWKANAKAAWRAMLDFARAGVAAP